MKRIIRLTIVLVLILNETVLAQTENNSNSLLWEVSGNDLVAPSYLFGTFHMMCEEDFEIKSKTKLR